VKKILELENNDIYFDALQEISNIGLGNAATALADLLNKKVEIAVPRACFIDLEGIGTVFDDLGELAACINLELQGDILGTILFIFTQKSILKLVDMLMGQEIGTTHELDYMGESAAMEIGNIMSGSFVNAIGGMTGLFLCPSVPVFAFDMVGAVFSSSILASGHYEEKILLIDTVFYQEQEEIKGHFFLLPEIGSLEKLFKSLGLSA
jgi:chemotaxis protein CheC